MRKYPIGIQDFKKLREENYLYIDKTQIIYNLIQTGTYYFLSRPRRFGKSLLLSTIKYLFLGEKTLFKNLWIENNFNFQIHPVIHISFSTLGYKEIGLENSLHQVIEQIAKEKNIKLNLKGLSPQL
ncbi:MAG: AAA family ATPase, partial [Bacteroidetes bacterium]|nr:AAA family ATPase [Bacteroidota bacterium]